MFNSKCNRMLVACWNLLPHISVGLGNRAKHNLCCTALLFIKTFFSRSDSINCSLCFQFERHIWGSNMVPAKEQWVEEAKGVDGLIICPCVWGLDRASLITQWVKNPPAMQKMWVWFLGWEESLEKEMATHGALQYSCLGGPMDRGAWKAAVQIGHKESDVLGE